MKRIFLVVATIVMIATQGFAQDFNFGVKGGLNLANLSDDLNEDTKAGFNLGVLAEFMINDQFSIQPEVLYSRQGTEKNDDAIKLDYINVPVMLKYYVAPGFSLQAGPQVGFLVDDDDEAKIISKKSDDVFKTVDFGLNFGLGYKFYNNIFVDARYNLGLTDVVDENDGMNGKNSVFQFSVGYMF